MTATATSLVGRDDELARLERLLEAVDSGSARFAILWGEPGIGKTSLLGALARRANDLGFLVLEGRGAEFERGLPFSVVLDALDPYLTSLDGYAASRLTAGWVEELAAVFPSLRELAPDAGAGATVTERFRSHHAVRELIERLSARQRLLIVLDDLQWSDSASVELVAHLLRRPPAGGVLVAGALRTGQAPAALTAAIEAAARERAVEQLELGPLAFADAERLMRGADDAGRERLYRESGGNPFYLEELVRSPPAARAAALSGVPAAVAAAIMGELDALPPAVRTLAEGAAVAGDPFDIDLAGLVADLPERETMTALDEFVARGLARTTDVPRRFAFRHPLVRAAVYEGFAPGSRLLAHARAAAVMATWGAPPAARAHHVEASARPGDEAAITALREAGDSVVQRDPAAAARWYEAALRLLPEGPDRRRLLAAHATALAAMGKALEAIEILGPLLDESPSPPTELAIMCSTLEHMVGRADSGRRRMTSLLEAVAADPTEEARVLMQRAVLARYEGRYDEMRRWAAAAVEAAERQPNPAVRAKALALRAYVRSYGADVPGALEDRSRVAAALAELEDAELSADLDAFVLQSSASFFLERYEDARAESVRALAAARAFGQTHWLPVIRLVLAANELALGNLAESARLNDDVIDAARLGGDPQGLAWGFPGVAGSRRWPATSSWR